MSAGFATTGCDWAFAVLRQAVLGVEAADAAALGAALAGLAGVLGVNPLLLPKAGFALAGRGLAFSTGAPPPLPVLGLIAPTVGFGTPKDFRLAVEVTMALLLLAPPPLQAPDLLTGDTEEMAPPSLLEVALRTLPPSAAAAARASAKAPWLAASDRLGEVGAELASDEEMPLGGVTGPSRVRFFTLLRPGVFAARVLKTWSSALLLALTLAACTSATEQRGEGRLQASNTAPSKRSAVLKARSWANSMAMARNCLYAATPTTSGLRRIQNSRLSAGKRQ